MRIMTLAVALLVTLVIASLSRADWKPADGPLMTRWAKDVSADKALPEYPRPQMVRKDWVNLNALWEMAFAKEGEEAPTGKTLDGQILVPFPVESALSGVMKHSDRLWYRRTFTIPKSWSGQHILLHFGAVDWEATVWVNGKNLGVHRGGYDPFEFDVTDVLKGDGDQELVVGVWDPTDAGPQPRGKQVTKPGGIFYTPTTGIWQTVWLEPVPQGSIESLKIVPDVDAGAVHLEVKIRGNPEKAVIRAEVCDGTHEVGSADQPVSKELAISVPNAKLWSPDTPFLYDLHVELMADGKPVDAVDSYFGMRKIGLGKDEKGITRVELNGKPIFMVGPLDQGFWPDGLYTAPTDAALKYDIEVAKKLGFNMARKHVKVEPDRWYYWCDRLGLLVWQDMPGADRTIGRPKGQTGRTFESDQQFEKELKAMVTSFHDHPSIIMWVVFNEGWGQHDTEHLVSLVKEWDPSRLVDNASGWTDMKVGDVHDIHAYPGPGAPEPEPNRAGVDGEFGGLGLAVEGHTWSKKSWGYRGTRDKEDLTRRYEKLLWHAWRLRDTRGLCAAVYTQITDVETECNGLMTYDREEIKVDVDRAAAAGRGQFANLSGKQEILVPTSEETGQTWRYTLQKPADDWFEPNFQDAGWKEGLGGFGTRGTPGAVVRTEWKTDDIWIRREFTLTKEPAGEVLLRIHHDEDADVYFNGVLAASVDGFTTEYEDAPVSSEARAALKPGRNVFAVHVKQTSGGQYIDVGLTEIRKPGR